MKLTERIAAAWRGFTGKKDAYAATYGNGSPGGFAGAAINRLTASLATWSGSVNADLDASLPILRARARGLCANNEHGKRFLSLVATNVVGRRNPKLQVRAMRDQLNPNKPATLDKAANDAIEIHWERWGKQADISGKHKSLYSFMRTAIKAVARDGETLVRIIRNRRQAYGLGLQLLEADRLDETLNMRLDNGNTIRQGVEVDSALRVVAYYIKTAHPGEHYALQNNTVERVPATDLIHLFLSERAEQIRGITWLHAVIMRGSIIHNFEEAAVVAAQIGASKIAALERADDAPDVTAGMADGTSAGVPQMSVQAGELFELPPGYKLNSWNPEYPHANFESFLKACLRGLASGLDVAAHNLTGDMTEVNYSSARIAELGERETWMILQDWFIDALVMPIYEEWLALALLSGKITFDISGKALPADRYEKFRNASRFQGRRWAWVDPSKEADANEKLLANQLTSRTRIASESGEEFDDILDELAAEQQLIDAAGLAPKAPEAPAPAAPPAAKALRALETELADLKAQMARLTAPPPAVHIHQGATTIENRIPEQAPPVVNVAPAEVRVDVAAPSVTIEPAAVEVRVDATMPEQPSPTVEVHVEAVMPETMRTEITAMPDRKTETVISRDSAGNIKDSLQIERDI